MITQPFPSDEQLTVLATQLGLTEPLSIEFLRLSLQNTQLFDKKHADYGASNIAAFGVFGCIVKMHDKLARLKKAITEKRRKMRNESFVDSLNDMSNYSIIARMCHEGRWPK